MGLAELVPPKPFRLGQSSVFVYGGALFSAEPRISFRYELKDTLKLAWPMVLNQVGQMSMGLVDTAVGGRLGTTQLAGLGLGANAFWTFTAVFQGLLLGLDTYFSQAVGAKDRSTLDYFLGQSFWSSALAATISAFAILGGALVYVANTSPGPVRDAFAVYVHTVLWCIPSLFFFFVLQRYWQARHHVIAFMWITVAGNVLNFVACLALGLGKWGFPRMEVQGIGIATVISRYVMLAAAMAYSWEQLKLNRFILPRLEWAAQGRIFRLGLPAAGHITLEVGAFTIATFVVSTLGDVSLAAHHVCLMMAAFTFMFPLGFSNAAAVRVGMFVGAGQPERARFAGWVSIGLSISIMSGFALAYLLFRHSLVGLFSNDPAVILLGGQILLCIAIFQIADGTQVSTTGALRGIGNTRSPLIANLIGHYPIGLALGLWLCFKVGFGTVGIWAGLATGLICVATMLILTWRHTTRDASKLRRLH